MWTCPPFCTCAGTLASSCPPCTLAHRRLCEQLASELNVPQETILRRLEGLHEANPMMGLRGCRLGTVHPEITTMQALAILEAAANVAACGVAVHPHIMIPLVGIEDELVGQAKLVHEAAEKVAAKTGRKVDYKVCGLGLGFRV